MTSLFTGKERDAETGLDYFGARYMASAQGRFTSPDAPFADQHPADPQSWNMYGYVRNNPLAYTDPNGRACMAIIGNAGSGYCQRAQLYANFDSLVHEKTRFFAAASAATMQIANVAVPGLGRVASAETRDFLGSVNTVLEGVNTQAVGMILSGAMVGSPDKLDAAMVHKEQTAVQKEIDKLSPTARDGVVKEINGLLNGDAGLAARALAGLAGAFVTSDATYGKVLAGVRKSLGRNIDFAKQGDREAIGMALVRHIRDTSGGGCALTDNQSHGCSK